MGGTGGSKSCYGVERSSRANPGSTVGTSFLGKPSSRSLQGVLGVARGLQSSYCDVIGASAYLCRMISYGVRKYSSLECVI